MGHQEGIAWVAQPGHDAAGYLAYGPYTKSIPSGARSATFVLAADTAHVSDNSVLLTLDVYASASGHVLSSRDVRRRDLVGSQAYTSLRLDFEATPGMVLEFRLRWNGLSKTYLDRVTVA